LAATPLKKHERSLIAIFGSILEDLVQRTLLSGIGTELGSDEVDYSLDTRNAWHSLLGRA
jgi:hypothetical protein